MKKTLLSSLAMALCIGFTSCGGGDKATDGTKSTTDQAENKESGQLKDDKLSSFMLGGIYFIEGYGGQSEVNGMITSTDKQEVVNSYKELLEFPFKPGSDAPAIKSTLKSMWGINDKAGLITTLAELKAGNPAKSKNRAWDFARLVNNVCMGYAAGYLNKDEAEKLITEVLPLAKKEFKTWEDYYADFNAGRKAWGGDPSADQTFVDATAAMLKGDKSIYQILPLN